MALIHVFDGLNRKTSYTFNGKLKDNLRGVDWDNTVILRGGYRIDENYEIQPNDIIYVRKAPTANPVAWGIGIGVAALLAGGATIAVAVKANQIKAQNEANKASQTNKGSNNAEKLPTIKGARNQNAAGRNIPFAIGQSLMTPYYLCSPHYTIEGDRGEKQYFNTVLEVAYNNLLINKIKLGETIIKDLSYDVSPQNGAYSWDSGIYYDEKNKIEIRQTGDFTDAAFNEKIVSIDVSKEIPHEHLASDASKEDAERIHTEAAAGVVQELPKNTKEVEIVVLFDGLQKMDSEGELERQTVWLTPLWTNVNNPTDDDWHIFNQGFKQGNQYSNIFRYNTKGQMRFAARQTFTAEETKDKTIKIKVVRVTPKAERSARENVYFSYVQATIFDTKKSTGNNLVTAKVLEDNERDQCCRIGVRIAANANTQGLLDAISVIETACARTWNGTAWSTGKTPTRNLAAWVLEILTNSHHRPSQYNDSEIDLESFGAWYEYCAQQGFNADGVITKGEKKKSIIDKLLSNGNAALVYNRFTGKMEVAIDNGRNYSVALFNSENIISISTQKQFKRKTDGRKIKYVNAAADYDIDTVKFMRDGGEYDPATDTLEEITPEYITEYSHAFKLAWRSTAEETAQPLNVTVKAGHESAYYPLFSRVELQHKSLKKSNAHGIIKALVWYGGLLKEIHLDGTVTFPQDAACGLIVNCVSDSGRGILPIKVSGTGKTNKLYVESTIRQSAAVIPAIGNHCSFGRLDNDGEFTTITTSMKIINAEENDNGYTLTLVNYNPAVYEYGTMPDYYSNITPVPNGLNIPIKDLREYTTPADVVIDAVGAAQAAADTVIKGVRFSNVYKIRPAEMSLEDIIRKMDDDARNASASISMNAEEILLQVDDMERELTGLISVQAGAVQAIVEGGGARGQMSLSINLPVTITAETLARLVAASTAEKVAAVYALIENTNYYGIKGNATDAAIKALWDDAVAAKLLASQIELQADQIYLNGDVIVNDQNKIKTTLLEVNEINAGLITAISQDPTAGHTVIDGGYLKTALIDVGTILGKNAVFTGTVRAANFSLSGYRAGNVVVKKINNPFNEHQTKKTYTIIPFGSGTFRLKLPYTSTGGTVAAYIHCTKCPTLTINSATSGVYTYDITISEGEEIQLTVDCAGGAAVGSYDVACSELTLSLSESNSMFTTLTQITMTGFNINMAR